METPPACHKVFAKLAVVNWDIRCGRLESGMQKLIISILHTYHTASKSSPGNESKLLLFGDIRYAMSADLVLYSFKVSGRRLDGRRWPYCARDSHRPMPCVFAACAVLRCATGGRRSHSASHTSTAIVAAWTCRLEMFRTSRFGRDRA